MAGIVGGAILLIFIFAFSLIKPDDLPALTITSTESATLIAGLGGASLGGLISWLLAKQTANEARKTAYDKETDQIKAGLWQLQIKMLNMTNGYYTMFNAINKAAELAKKDGGPIWRFLQHTSGPYHQVTLETHDYIPLIYDDGANLVTDLAMLSERYHAAVDGYKDYCRLRAEFQEFSIPYTVFTADESHPEKLTHRSVYPPELGCIATLKMQELEGLIQNIKEYLEIDLPEAKLITQKLNDYSTKRLEKRGSKFIKLKFK